MMLVDANLLLYAVNTDAPWHKAAKEWLEAVLSGPESVGFTWPVLLAFLRISTRRAIFPTPLEPSEAYDLVDSWLAQPCVTVVQPTPDHWAVLRRLLEPLGTAGNLTADAHLAAIAIEHGADLYSTDRDFGRFPAVQWVNPVEPTVGKPRSS